MSSYFNSTLHLLISRNMLSEVSRTHRHTRLEQVGKISEVEYLTLLEKKNDWNREVIPKTYEECRAASQQHQNKLDFSFYHWDEYQTCRLEGWLEELTAHMPKRKKTTLDYEFCKKVCLSFTSKKDLVNNHQSVYQKCRQEGWLAARVNQSYALA